MDLERILKYCHNSAEAEKRKSTPSADKIKTLEEILDFIKNNDTPQDKERIGVKAIFQKHHKQCKGTNYVFTKNQESEIDGIIIQIKQEMAENMESYADMTTEQFFELFMANMDEWWKLHQFTTWGINKQFRKILSQILSNKSNTGSGGKSGSNKKPSYSQVMNHSHE